MIYRGDDGGFYLGDWVDKAIKWAWVYVVVWALTTSVLPAFVLWILATPVLILAFALYIEFQLDTIAAYEAKMRLKEEERSGKINS